MHAGHDTRRAGVITSVTRALITDVIVGMIRAAAGVTPGMTRALLFSAPCGDGCLALIGIREGGHIVCNSAATAASATLLRHDISAG
jgi:hypothetical protein